MLTKGSIYKLFEMLYAVGCFHPTVALFFFLSRQRKEVIVGKATNNSRMVFVILFTTLKMLFI